MDQSITLAFRFLSNEDDGISECIFPFINLYIYKVTPPPPFFCFLPPFLFLLLLSTPFFPSLIFLTLLSIPAYYLLSPHFPASPCFPSSPYSLSIIPLLQLSHEVVNFLLLLLSLYYLFCIYSPFPNRETSL